jgi:coenzyme F420-dependent glucose-6-phosphate dehydrogenase
MPELGYWLSSEEHGPRDLVDSARAAEEAGFGFAVISDHFHPWNDKQGQSPFVWSVIGGIASATERITIGTGVTCPLIRIHPAIIAQAAATSAAMLPGRFFLGVGTGENLNEHVTGAKWPAPDERLELLEEAVAAIRRLWEGGYQTHRGRHYTVERARLYTLPDEPPPIVVAAAQEKAAELAAKIGDGYMNTAPDADTLKTYEQAGGKGQKHGKVTGCWGPDRDKALKQAHELWANTGLGGSLGQELALPSDFEAATETVRPEDLAASLALGDDPDAWLEQIAKFDKAGFTHVAVHHIGDDQAGFVQFVQRELVPRL